jgi:sulfonate transport system substrate-binding protein
MPNSIRIGVHSHNLSVFTLSRKPELLEDLLQPTGISVEWIAEKGGKQTVKLLKAGEIDIGATGTTPPILAQAEGVPVVYLATSQPRPVHGAIVVPEDSTIHEIADLKGKTVALSEGSYQQHLLAIALDKAGLTYQDVKTVDYRTVDIVQAFLKNEVDVWVAADLTLAEVQKDHKFRVLLYSSDLFSNRSIYFTHRPFAEKYPEALAAFIRALERVDRWIATHFSDAAKLLATEIGDFDASSWELSLRKRPWGLVPPSQEFIAEQQYAADVFERFNLIPNKINVSEALLSDPLSVFETNFALSRK